MIDPNCNYCGKYNPCKDHSDVCPVCNTTVAFPAASDPMYHGDTSVTSNCRHLIQKRPVGRPERPFKCLTCGKTMGSAAVRVHKCASADLKREEQV